MEIEESKYIDDYTFEVNASDLYELGNNAFRQHIIVKESFSIQGQTPYTLINGQKNVSMPIHHKGIDLVKHANGKFLCKKEIPHHITIISVL